jgi:hypothetical protein
LINILIVRRTEDAMIGQADGLADLVWSQEEWLSFRAIQRNEKRRWRSSPGRCETFRPGGE